MTTSREEEQQQKQEQKQSSREVASSAPGAPSRNDGTIRPAAPPRNDVKVQDKATPQDSRPAPSPGSELDTVIRAWEAVLKQVKDKKMSTFALLVECRPVAVEGDNVTLEFHEQADFHKAGVEKEANRTFIEGVLRDITGKPYKIKCVTGKEQAGNQKPKTKDQKPEGQDIKASSRGVPTHDPERRGNSDEAMHSGKIVPRKAETEDKKPKPKDQASPLTADEKKETQAEGDGDKLAAIKGLFDATLLETREITDED